jgi:hypothetical protein
MTKCPLCGIDLDIDNVELQSHLSDRDGNRVEMALANILKARSVGAQSREVVWPLIIGFGKQQNILE